MNNSARRDTIFKSDRYSRSGLRNFSQQAATSGTKVKDPNNLLKKGIWAYFLLLIFEGALRKWVLPGLATPLLVVRDPIAIWLVASAMSRGLLPSNPYLNSMFGIGVIATLTTLAFGHGNIFVDLFGARTFLLHFPLIFVIGRIFNREDVVRIGKATLWIAIPTAALVALQFYSPQSAWVNRGVGGSLEGAGFTGTMGYFRPPGTFSFTNGNSLFYSFAACYIFYFWLKPKEFNKLVLIAATAGLFLVVPLSISRSLFFSIAVTFMFVIIASARKPKFLGQMIIAVIGAALVVVILSQFPFFDTAKEVFTARFTNANESEGGLQGVLVDRYLGGMIGALNTSGKLPFFGAGLGYASNVGSMLLSGETVSAISEGEWGRLIGEMGALMGMLVILIRLAFSLKLTMLSYKKLAAEDILPWLLLSFFLLTMPQGNWAQPTSLGFCVVIGGLVLASLRNEKAGVSTKINLNRKENSIPVVKQNTFGRIV